MSDPAAIGASLSAHLSNEITCELLSENDTRVSCLTPLDYPSGDGITVWAQQQQAGFTVTDFGESLSELLAHPAQDYKALMDEATNICEGVDVDFMDGAVSTKASDQDVGDAIWRVATAAARIAQMSVSFHPQRRKREKRFLSEVEDVLRQHQLPVERERRIEGSSGHEHRASLFLPQREIILEPVGGAGNWNQISTIYTKFGDLSRTNGFKFWSVVDDREEPLREDLANMLVQVSEVMAWSRRDRWLESLRY